MLGHHNEIQGTVQTRCALRSGKSVEHTITVEVVVEMVDRGEPPTHALQLPLSFAVLHLHRRNIGIKAEPFELPSSEG